MSDERDVPVVGQVDPPFLCCSLEVDRIGRFLSVGVDGAQNIPASSLQSSNDRAIDVGVRVEWEPTSHYGPASPRAR